MLSRFLREPLIQFLLLGAALFALYSLVSEDGGSRRDRIVVDAGQVARLTQQFQRTWMRLPTQPEIDGLIEEHVKEEILYREALALGLDRDDLVVRRRLRQKMEFLNEDIIAHRQPTDAELQAFLDAHPDKFRAPARLSFTQVFVNPGKHGPDASKRATAILASLAKNGPADAAGDATLLPGEVDSVTVNEIEKMFGSDFAAALEKIAGDDWAGPIASSYGLHLVRITSREAGRALALADVRPVVEREWSVERRAEAAHAFYAALRKRYEVSVEVSSGAARKDGSGGK